ncbi:hypothetical protein [Weissella viridescens]
MERALIIMYELLDGKKLKKKSWQNVSTQVNAQSSGIKVIFKK